MFRTLDNKFHGFLKKWGVDALRISLGLVFFWFGMLKVMDETPVTELIQSSFSFLPFEFPIFWLGVLETFIGVSLFFKFALRLSLGVMWLMLAGTFSSLFFNPDLFFNDSIFLLTTEGEFVIKNFVLLTAGMVIGAFEVKPR